MDGLVGMFVHGCFGSCTLIALFTEVVNLVENCFIMLCNSVVFHNYLYMV